LIKEFSGGLLKGILIGMKGLDVLIMRFRKRKISGYLRRLIRERGFSINEHIVLIRNGSF